MRKKINLLICMLFAVTSMYGQSYVNEMLKSDVERDCYIEGGGVLYNDASTEYYGDNSYVQKQDTNTPTAFIFNREIWNDKNLTGFRINMFIPKDVASVDDFVKIEYSTDEQNYLPIPDMKVEISFDAVIGNNYWNDIYFQASLPAGVKEIKVTLIANPTSANWIPCYRRTEIFYEGGNPYQYMTPPYLQKLDDTFMVDFESDNFLFELGGQNTSSIVEVASNPLKNGINTSNNVLKIVQDPTDPTWGWGNADWFGVAIALKNGEAKQNTKITEKGRYLKFMIYRTNNSVLGMETWGGTCTYKDQAISYTGDEGWQMVSIDLNEFLNTTFESFYFSPNEKFGTNAISVAETTYIDDICISETSAVENVFNNIDNNIKIIGAKGKVNIIGAEGKGVAVYAISGALVTNLIVTGTNSSIELNPGLYIVKAGDKVSKAIVY
ncbi:MAG: DUF6383 domain-containing protein [Muribaculaceae bacterium]|nr:DUF6383 domain-containing protein [Muribaculaceae bacterium]